MIPTLPTERALLVLLCNRSGRFIPWIVFLPAVVRRSIADGWRALRRENPELIFFWVWIAFVVLFFSISRSKLVPYIIPVYPAFCDFVWRVAFKKLVGKN